MTNRMFVTAWLVLRGELPVDDLDQPGVRLAVGRRNQPARPGVQRLPPQPADDAARRLAQAYTGGEVDAVAAPSVDGET